MPGTTNRHGEALVDFAIIGAMKSGTSTLFSWLGAHPDTEMCVEKEPNYFSVDQQWRRGAAWYDGLYSADRRAGKARGEASTSYTAPGYNERCAKRMSDVAPDIRLIYLLRDPIERVRSHYRHEVQRNREARPLIDALNDPTSPYLARSKYWTCLEPFVTQFEQQQILVVRFEDLIGADSGTWSDVLRHTGLSPIARPTSASNVTAEKQQFTPVMRWLWERNLLPSRNALPSSVRRAAKHLMLRDSRDYRQLLIESTKPIPAALATEMWRDIEQLESWLGRDTALWNRIK